MGETGEEITAGDIRTMGHRRANDGVALLHCLAMAAMLHRWMRRRFKGRQLLRKPSPLKAGCLAWQWVRMRWKGREGSGGSDGGEGEVEEGMIVGDIVTPATLSGSGRMNGSRGIATTSLSLLKCRLLLINRQPLRRPSLLRWVGESTIGE